MPFAPHTTNDMADFFLTRAGVRLTESTLPDLVEAVTSCAIELKRLNNNHHASKACARELNNIMELYTDKKETVEEIEKYKEVLRNLYHVAGARGECNTPEEYELRIKEGIVYKLG